MEFADQHNIRLSIFLPTLMLGPAVLPEHAERFAAYENPDARGRYFGVYDSWHYKDIYAELETLMPEAKMPAPLSEPPLPPTGFDFTRRDSLGVPLRDVPPPFSKKPSQA